MALLQAITDMASNQPQGHSFLKPKLLRRNDVKNKPKRKSTMESVIYTILPSIDRGHNKEHLNSDKEEFKEENVEEIEHTEGDDEDRERKEEDIEDIEHKEASDAKRRLVQSSKQD